MPNRDDILWFKQSFGADVTAALAGTPFDLDFIAAIACQETGEVWPLLRHRLPPAEVLRLCVGDTLDADRGRRAFPRTRDELLAAADGAAMFDIARRALVEMAEHVPAYRGAAGRPHKFCHGFGMFQLDLQFFRSDPQYFLQRRYEHFQHTLARCIGELTHAVSKIGLDGAPLGDFELAAVGIAYNTGRFVPGRQLRQGHFDGRRFYGEALFDFIRLARTVALPGEAPALPAPPAGTAIVPPPTRPGAPGALLRVDTRTTTLRLRSAPRITRPRTANVIADLPDGHPVRAVGGAPVNGFLEVETSLAGALLRGFASTDFLVPAPELDAIPVVEPARPDAPPELPAAHMPRRPGHSTRRSERATAHSLDEPGQPAPRRGSSAAALRDELNAIVDWLDVERAAHARYAPRDGLTFCNVYAHDVCHLAGVYLPRVWWSSPALLALQRGEDVRPLIGDTLREMRANDLFRWLREFGPAFGWRQTGTLDKLQEAADQGALALVIARRKEDGRSGHVAMVVPETPQHAARRDAAGTVVAPLQSQAGARNFARGTGARDWWKGEQFAESAFWIHA